MENLILKIFYHLKKNIVESKFNFTKIKTSFLVIKNKFITNDDILIKLPQDNLTESLNLAYKIINSNDFKNKNLIDLRINNHLIIK